MDLLTNLIGESVIAGVSIGDMIKDQHDQKLGKPVDERFTVKGNIRSIMLDPKSLKPEYTIEVTEGKQTGYLRTYPERYIRLTSKLADLDLPRQGVEREKSEAIVWMDSNIFGMQD